MKVNELAFDIAVLILRKLRTQEKVDLMMTDPISCRRVWDHSKEAALALQKTDEYELNIPFIASRSGQPIHFKHLLKLLYLDKRNRVLLGVS